MLERQRWLDRTGYQTGRKTSQDENLYLPFGEFRQHGHQLIDWIADYLKGIEQRPVTPSVAPSDIEPK